ncbi:MAG: SDR family NAD(P)-dependent oxidoreductase [Pseudomonadota bacterium]
MDISGKTALLTGGTAGIGRALAIQLRDAGASVIVTGRNPDRLEEMRAAGFEAIAADLSSAAGVEALVASWGGRALDILINNAGMGVTQDYRGGSPEPDDSDACFYANLSAPVRLTTRLLPLLKAQPRACILNVSSGLAIAPSAQGAVYCASKAGLRSFSYSLRQQLKGTGVIVIEALPPVVETQMTSDRGGSKMTPEDCARAMVDAIKRDRAHAYIGMVSILKWVHGLSPALARRVMLNF